MLTMPSTKAKTHFGALLDTAQREPVTIEKKGRPVAVVISETDFKAYQKLKLEALQSDLNDGIKQANQKQLVDQEEAFNGLI